MFFFLCIYYGIWDKSQYKAFPRRWKYNLYFHIMNAPKKSNNNSDFNLIQSESSFTFFPKNIKDTKINVVFSGFEHNSSKCIFLTNNEKWLIDFQDKANNTNKMLTTIAKDGSFDKVLVHKSIVSYLVQKDDLLKHKTLSFLFCKKELNVYRGTYAKFNKKSVASGYLLLKNMDYLEYDKLWRKMLGIIGLLIMLKNLCLFIYNETVEFKNSNEFYDIGSFLTNYQIGKFIDSSNDLFPFSNSSLFFAFKYILIFIGLKEFVKFKPDMSLIHYITLIGSYVILEMISELSSLIIFALFSIIFIQIFFSAINNQNKTIKTWYLLLSTYLNYLIIVAIHYYSFNEYFCSYKLLLFILFWIILQLIINFSQNIFGCGFFIPKEYRKKVPEFKIGERLDENTTCPICLDEINENDDYLTTPCNHTFHKNCILTWLADNGTCPVCRDKLPENVPE